MVKSHHTARDVGDEAVQYFFDQAHEVHVCERRKDAVLSMNRSNDHVLLLDDALQHRYVRAGLTILVSDYNRPFSKITPYLLVDCEKVEMALNELTLSCSPNVL